MDPWVLYNLVTRRCTTYIHKTSRRCINLWVYYQVLSWWTNLFIFWVMVRYKHLTRWASHSYLPHFFSSSDVSFIVALELRKSWFPGAWLSLYPFYFNKIILSIMISSTKSFHWGYNLAKVRAKYIISKWKHFHVTSFYPSD